MAIDTAGNVLSSWESPNGSNRGGVFDIESKNGDIYYCSSELTVSGTQNFTTHPDITKRNSMMQKLWSVRPALSVPLKSGILRTIITKDSSAIIGVGAISDSGPYLQFKVNLTDGSIIYQREDSVCVPNMSPPIVVPGQGTYSPVIDAELYDVALLSSGSIISCGKVRTYMNNGTTAWSGYILKTNAWGQDLLDDCSTISSEEPQYTQNEVFIYPNPCTEYFTLEQPEGYSGAYRVRMYTSAGALVREQEYVQGAPSRMEAQDLQSGLYFVQVLSKKGHLLSVGKVMVAR
jgi:Secretion system C-terminal sorting domain